MVSGTIQLPSALYWISPPFKIKRQISLNPPLDPTGRIMLFFQTAQEPVPPARPSKSHPYNSEHCGILLPKLCIYKYQVKLQKGVLFLFYCIFVGGKKSLYGVYMYYILYYVIILCIVVLSEYYK